MTRDIKKVTMGDGRTQITVLLRDIEAHEPLEIRQRFFSFLRELGDQPNLLFCETDLPSRIDITFDGERWAARAEVKVKEA